MMEDLSYVNPAKPVNHDEPINNVGFEGYDRIPKRFSFSLDERSVDAIQVYLRMKPDGDISNEGFLSVVEEEESTTSLILKKKTTFSKFSFTYIFKPNATQEEVFLKSTEAKLQEFFYGRSAFLFTYGTSSSGKTFTIHGKKNNPGLIPRIIATIFATLNNSIDDSFSYCPERSVSVVQLSENEMLEKSLMKERILTWAKSLIQSYFSKSEGIISFDELQMLMMKAKKLEVYDKDNSTFSIWCSFAEIYNEKIYDLLDEPKEIRSPLSLSMDRDKQVFIKGLKHIHVTTLEEAYLLYFYGCYNRSVNCTALNERSSRSHSIFTIKILGRKKEERDQFFLSSSFSVCDLAGTERFSKTKNFGNRMKESRNINTSFLVLNRCLKIIRENQLREVDHVVPFRESKLTQIMGTSFTAGDTNLLMIVTVAQSPNLMDETEASLKSSAIATEIKAIIPSSVGRKKNMRFSNCFSHLGPGCGVNWNDIVTSNNKRVVSSLFQNESSQLINELEIERSKRQALEKKLAEVEKIHKEDIEKLIERNKELEKKVNLETSGAVQECTTLRRKMEELYDKYMDSKADILKWKKKLRLQKDDYDQLQKDFEKLTSTTENLENMLDDAKEEVEELHDEVKALHEKLLEKDEALALKEEKISMLELEISQLEENLEDNACERETYERLLNTLEEDLLKKKGEIEDLNHHFNDKCREYEEKIYLLEKRKRDESRKVKIENGNVPILIEDYSSEEYCSTQWPSNGRSKSEECLHLNSDSDDPSFVLSNNKCKTTVKKKKRRQNKESKSLYFDGPNNLTPNKNSGASARRKLYKKTSEEALDEPSDCFSSDTTQASPNTIFRTLRTGKKY